MPTKSVPVVFADGRTRHLRYDFNAFCTLEEVLHLPIADFGKKLGKRMALKELRAVLYAGLIHEDPELTVKEAGELLEAAVEKGQMEKVGAAIAEAFNNSFGTGEPKNANEPEQK
jgi:hypothetical protein